MEDQACRVCGCTDYDCTQCVERTGQPCHWVEDDLCSACKEELKMQKVRDEDWISASVPVWQAPPKEFIKEYARIRHLYNGTSFQKKYYPKQYEEYLRTTN